MAAVANRIQSEQSTALRAVQSLGESPLELNDPAALNLAFRAFNDLSNELSSAYELLQTRVEQLTREVENANRQRLQEISEKERIASRLENLLQLLPGGVIVLNRQGQVTS